MVCTLIPCVCVGSDLRLASEWARKGWEQLRARGDTCVIAGHQAGAARTLTLILNVHILVMCEGAAIVLSTVHAAGGEMSKAAAQAGHSRVRRD